MVLSAPRESVEGCPKENNAVKMFVIRRVVLSSGDV